MTATRGTTMAMDDMTTGDSMTARGSTMMGGTTTATGGTPAATGGTTTAMGSRVTGGTTTGTGGTTTVTGGMATARGRKRQHYHHHQRTNRGTIVNTFTSPDNSDLFKHLLDIGSFTSSYR